MGQGVEWGQDLVIIWVLSFALPHFLHIPHSVWDNLTAAERTFCSSAELACAKFTMGVSGISIFTSKTDWQHGGQSREWAGSHTVVFYRLHPSLPSFHLVFRSLSGVIPSGMWSSTVSIGLSLGQGCQPSLNKCYFIWGNSCMPVQWVGMPEEKWASAAPTEGTERRIMLAATVTAALIYFTVHNSGLLALGTACWDERLSRAGRNGSCVGELVQILGVKTICVEVLTIFWPLSENGKIITINYQ